MFETKYSRLVSQITAFFPFYFHVNGKISKYYVLYYKKCQIKSKLSNFLCCSLIMFIIILNINKNVLQNHSEYVAYPYIALYFIINL